MEIIEEGLGEEMIMATEQLEASATQYAKQLAGSAAATLPVTPQYHFGTWKFNTIVDTWSICSQISPS